MADRENRGSELVFCHQCQNEWNRDEHGLECPECHSEFVEVVSSIYELSILLEPAARHLS